MIYIDESGNRIETYDLGLGHLVDHEWIDHPAIERVGHYEYDKNGIQSYVVDVPASPAWREVTVQKYVPYSESELLHMAALRYAERLDLLEIANVEQQKTNQILSEQVAEVSDRGDFIEDCLAEMAGIVYA